MSPRKPVTFEIKTRRGLVAIVAVAAIMLPIATYLSGSRVADNSQQVADNCEGIHKIVVAGVRILDSERNLRDAYRNGLISQEQMEAGLARVRPFQPLTEQNLKTWRSADCR